MIFSLLNYESDPQEFLVFDRSGAAKRIQC